MKLINLQKTAFAFILFVLSFNNSTQAQFLGPFTAEQLKSEFLPTTTLVLLTGNEQFDNNIRLGMEEFWTLTKYRFVEIEEIKKIGKSKEYSTIQPITTKYESSSYEHTDYCVYLPSKKDVIVAKVNHDNGTGGLEKEFIDGAYRAKHYIKFLSDVINLRLSGQLTGRYGFNQDLYLTLHNLKSSIVPTKTLLVNEKLVGKGVKEAFEKSYPGKVSYVTASEIEEAINDGNSDYCYLLSISPGVKRIYIVDASTGEILHESEFRHPLFRLLPSEVSKVGKSITKSTQKKKK